MSDPGAVFHQTSRMAPPIAPDARLSYSGFSCTTGPRAMFTRTARLDICASSVALTRPWVVGSSGVQTMTKSDSANSLGFIESSPIHASGAGGCCGGFSVVAPMRMPKAAARTAMASPMFPYPKMPNFISLSCPCIIFAAEQLAPGGPSFHVQLRKAASILGSFTTHCSMPASTYSAMAMED